MADYKDYLPNVAKYATPVDEAAVKGIVRHCGIALAKRDSSLVSMTDKKERDRVRDSFLKKKLALTAPEGELDAAVASVGATMQAEHDKSRVTVYYLLAAKFEKLDLFH
jgi:Protein of unknown function (DUF2853)